LQLNAGKCEVICPSSQTHPPSINVFHYFIRVDVENSLLLGAPLFTGSALDSTLKTCCDDLSRAIDRLKDIQSHDALILLRSSFSAPKIQHLLRCSPCIHHPSLTAFDDLLRSGLSLITNCDLTQPQWMQATLPVREGGLGLRCATSLAIPALLASASSTFNLQSRILANCPDSVSTVEDKYRQTWSSSFPDSPVPTAPASFKQCTWDQPGIQSVKSDVWNSAQDSYSKARLAAASSPHSGDWLHALPVSVCGLKLDDEAVRVAVGLRLGVNLCIPHQCPCGLLVDANASHSLSCKLAFGRMARHQSLNDIIYRAFVAANIPATKEPVGLLRSDGKRPDGLTLIPWQAGKSLTWDVTVSHPLADSYLSSSAQIPGGVAEQAARRKEDKYTELSRSYLFQPISFETLGTVNSSAQSFIRELGRRIYLISNDCRESAFLFQRLSVAVQRFNAVAFRGGFISLADPDL